MALTSLMGASSSLSAPLLIQLPPNALEKAAEGGPSVGLVQLRGKLGRSSWILVLISRGNLLLVNSHFLPFTLLF